MDDTDVLMDIDEMDPQNKDFPFMASLDSLKQFLQLLKSLTFKDRANFFISNNGLKVMVQDSKSMQLSAYFLRQFFHEFYLKIGENTAAENSDGEGDGEEEEKFSFNINLNSVIHCLELFGDHPAPRLKLSYGGYGHPLNLYLDEDDIVMHCQINTYDVEDCADFNFAKSTVLTKVILNSEHFKDVVSTIQSVPDDIKIQITDNSICFGASSIFGDMSNEIPSDSSIVESFACTAPVSAKYSSHMLRQGLKPINFSQKLSIRIDARDLLCIQHMIEVDEHGGHAFTEVYCVPAVPDDDEQPED
eukprot:TRINITY_DN3575_c0_g1_i11.p1 TRINITY_DN3575_c0_g1~~TRINITY_DN3575_c0_g1_i11.p1  ORF type:complete len:303 (+),score=40.58 TRINITY_DN3575_c0_g1_i11:49-957(+)